MKAQRISVKDKTDADTPMLNTSLVWNTKVIESWNVLNDSDSQARCRRNQ